MWNESATSARECTEYPTISSKKKNTVSIANSIIIRVDFENAIFAVRRAKDDALVFAREAADTEDSLQALAVYADAAGGGWRMGSMQVGEFVVRWKKECWATVVPSIVVD